MLEERITELEMRYTLQQDILRELSDVVLAQGRAIDRLHRELESLRSRADAAAPAPSAEERPPHY